MGMMNYYCTHLSYDTTTKQIIGKPFSKWSQANGKKIKVKNMTISHLMNSIEKIKRDNWRTNWLGPLLKELESR